MKPWSAGGLVSCATQSDQPMHHFPDKTWSADD
jgi:hypothetical protein